ncbi:MAG: hypothetical protein WAP51_03105 [Candidatus Sungiibacteriota bacterium]
MAYRASHPSEYDHFPRALRFSVIVSDEGNGREDNDEHNEGEKGERVARVALKIRNKRLHRFPLVRL